MLEFDHWLVTQRDKECTDSLKAWKKLKGVFSKLIKWTRNTYSARFSGSNIEREFSISGRVITKQRNRLIGETISDIMYYKRWATRRDQNFSLYRQRNMREVAFGSKEGDSNDELKFEERNKELENWLNEWMKSKDVLNAAEALFNKWRCGRINKHVMYVLDLV